MGELLLIQWEQGLGIRYLSQVGFPGLMVYSWELL